MRILSEKKALEKLQVIQRDFARRIRDDYEAKAASCLTCKTPGACCLDAHFVNVHVSRLEAAAIRRAIAGFDEQLRARVAARVETAVATYELSQECDTFGRKFACPLFEKGVGCLVHETGKPAACVTHACYENAEDLPPDELQAAQERKIDDLNARVYGHRDPWLPIPLAIRK